MHVHSYRISIDITAPAEDTKAADIVGANTKTQNTALSNFCLTMAIALLCLTILLPFANMNIGTPSTPSSTAMVADRRRNDRGLRQNGQ